MKALFLSLLVIISMHSYAQKILVKGGQKEWTACEKLVVLKIDEITADTSIMFQSMTFTDPVYQGNAIASIQYISDSNKVALDIKFRGECIYLNAAIHLLFKDTTRLILKNKLEYNCYGDAQIELNNYRDNINLLKELSTKPIKAIRIETAYNSTQRYLSDIEAKNFIFLTNCVLETIGK